MSLYQKVRPSSWDEFLGDKNKATVVQARSLTEGKNPPHGILLFGPSGCGKTTAARLIGKSLGVINDDFREVDSADFRGIDTIRDIRHAAQYKALHGTRRCWLLDEVHRLPSLSQDALLKGLEDPPEHCFYVLCTTEPEKLLPTILSRCVQLQVYPLTEEEMVRHLNRVVRKEGSEVSRATLQRIAESSQGRPRAALTLLQKVLASGDTGEANLASVEDTKAKAIDLCRELMKPSSWKSVSAILSGLKEEEPESVRRAVLGYAAAVLVRGENDRAGLVLDEFMSPTYDSGYAGLVYAAYSVVRQA
jgi:DNA polymerase-3 subunit gamma/tau